VLRLRHALRSDLERVARAWALLHGRTFVAPEDVEVLFLPVLGHRLVVAPDLMFEEDLTRQQAIERVFASAVKSAPRPEPDWDLEAPAAKT